MGYNFQYFDNVDLQVQVSASCPELQNIATEITTAANQIISTATSQLALVETDFNALANSIAALEAQIATLAGSQASFSAVSVQAGTVGSAVDLPSIIAYLNAQASVMITLGDANVLTFIKEAVTLGQDLINVTTAYNRLQNQITSLEELLTDIPERLASITSSIATKAATFPNCTISV